jgi:hypothetical protein
MGNVGCNGMLCESNQKQNFLEKERDNRFQNFEINIVNSTSSSQHYREMKILQTNIDRNLS